MDSQGGHEAHLSGGLGPLREGEEVGSIEVAGFAHPVSAVTPATQRLLICQNPERPAFAGFSEPAGLQVGRIDPVEMEDRMSRREDQ